MNNLFVEGYVRDHTDTMMRDAARSRLLRQAGARRRRWRGSRGRPAD